MRLVPTAPAAGCHTTRRRARWQSCQTPSANPEQIEQARLRKGQRKGSESSSHIMARYIYYDVETEISSIFISKGFICNIPKVK